jgi:hypothetical protein
MNYQKEVNHYLGVRFIKAPIYSEAEVKEKIGVSLIELRHLWIFSSKNYFKEAVKDLIKNGVKIDFNKANKQRGE